MCFPGKPRRSTKRLSFFAYIFSDVIFFIIFDYDIEFKSLDASLKSIYTAAFKISIQTDECHLLKGQMFCLYTFLCYQYL